MKGEGDDIDASRSVRSGIGHVDVSAETHSPDLSLSGQCQTCLSGIILVQHDRTFVVLAVMLISR